MRLTTPCATQALVLIAALSATACSGDDPTAPRTVRSTETATTVTSPDVRQDASAPTRGLPCEIQLGSVRLCGAATDNYKASYNEHPDVPELRTWLAVHELELNGDRYRVSPGQPLTQNRLPLTAAAGSADVSVESAIISGPASRVTMRAGPQIELWGPLVQLADRQRLIDEPVVVRLTVHPGGESVTVRYEHDPSLAGAPASSLEHNGPGGRWSIGALPTATNLELGWE